MERWANSQEIPRFRGGYRLGKEIAGEYTRTQRKTADEDLHGEWIGDRRARERGREGEMERPGERVDKKKRVRSTTRGDCWEKIF